MKIAVMGAGSIGRMHAAHLMATEGVTEVELVGRDAARLADHAKKVAERAGSEGSGVRLTTTTDADASLGSSDGVVITTPGTTHPKLVSHAVRWGLPVFVEKPLATSVEEYRELLRELEEAGADERVMVGFHRRHSKEFKTLKGLLDAEQAGPLRAVFSVDHDKYSADPAVLAGSGGIFADMMAHDFDVVPWLVGQQAATVYATGSVVANSSYRDHDQLDTATALLTFPTGLTATISVMRGHAIGQDVRTVVHGTDNSYSVGEAEHVAMTRIDTAGGITPPEATFEGYQDRFASAFVVEMQDFVAMAAGNGLNDTPPSSGVPGVELLDAAQRSIRSGRPEEVRPLR